MSTTTFTASTSTGSTNTMPTSTMMMTTSTSTVAVGMDIGSCNARIATFDTNLQHPVVAANHDGHRETKVLWSSSSSMLGSGADLVDSPTTTTTTTEDPTSRMGLLEQQQQQQQELQPVTTAEQLKGFVQSKLLTLAASSAHTKDLSIVASIPNDYYNQHHDQQDNGGDGKENGNGAESDDVKPNWWLTTLQQSMNCAVITEAAAIVLAYRVDPCRYRNVLILDGGASSFKATVLAHAGDGLWRQVHFAKLASVHGPALVEPLAQAVAQQFEQQNRRAIPGGRGEVWQSKKARMKLLAVCEQALSHFQRLPSVAIHVDGLYDGIDCNVTMSKPKWEHLSRPLANQVKAFCQQVVMDVAKIEGHPCRTIDTVLIAGNLHDWIVPIVKETLGGDKLHPNMNTLDPSEAIALGCTYQSYWNLQSQQSQQQQQQSSQSSSSSPKFGNKDDNKENMDRNKQDDDFLLSKNPTLTVVCSPVEIGIQQQQLLSPQEEQSTTENGHDAHVASSSTASSSAPATTTLTTLIAKGTPLPCQVEYEIVHNPQRATATTVQSMTSIFQLVQTVPTFKVLMQLDVNDNDEEEEDPEMDPTMTTTTAVTTTTTTTTTTTHLQLQLSVQGRLRIQINKEESYYLE